MTDEGTPKVVKLPPPTYGIREAARMLSEHLGPVSHTLVRLTAIKLGVDRLDGDGMRRVAEHIAARRKVKLRFAEPAAAG